MCHVQISKKAVHPLRSPRTYPDCHMTLYLDRHQSQENHFQRLGHVLVHNDLC